MPSRKRAQSTDVAQPHKKCRGSDPGPAFYGSSTQLALGERRMGMILSVTLRNFMCHENLKFDFTPNINFIVGRNGSGKSAVLIGIILALGGKSNATGRYSQIKQFIQTGKNTAVIVVTLSNEGYRPYKPDLYGSKIVVERTINSDGNSYKLKSEAGRIIATKKEDLEKILDYFKIQIDNPISVLTQDISRNFLDSRNPKDKYKLFYKATQLEKLHGNYTNADNRRKDSELLLKQRKDALSDMEKELKKWEHMLRIQSKIPLLQNELAWACVIDIERQRDAIKQEYSVAQRRHKAAKDKLENAEQKHIECCEKLEIAKAKLYACKKDMEILKKEIYEIETVLTPLSDQKLELKGKINKADREIKKNNEEIRNLNKSINEIQQKSQQDLMEEQRRREMEIARLTDVMSNSRSKESELYEQQEALNKQCSERESVITQLEQKKSSVFEIIKKVADDLKVMKPSMQIPVNIFGPYMQDLLNEIESAAQKGLFKHAPIGPIGRYLQVKDKDWSFAIETFFGSGFLRSFCCDNLQDRATLYKMIDKHSRPHRGKPPTIITSEFLPRIHNVQQYRVQSKHPTVLDLIECENPVILNCLIDQKYIESVLLIKNRDEALNVMMSNPPRNCMSCYLPNGDQIYPHPKYRYYSCKINPANSFRLLQSVKEDDIRLKQSEYEQLNEKNNRIDQEIKSRAEEVIKLRHKAGDLLRQLKTIVYEIETIKQRIADLQYVEEPKDLNCLQEDLEAQHVEKQRLEKQKNELLEMFNEKCVLHNEYVQRKELKRESFKKESTKCVELEQQVVEYEGRKENCISEKKSCEAALRRENDALVSVEKDYKDAEKHVETTTNNALALCPRINTSRSTASIETIITETNRRIEEDSKCNRQNVKDEFHNKKKGLATARTEIDRLASLIERLEKMIEIRLHGFNDILKNTSLILEYNFKLNLKSNKYDGNLIFSHGTGALTVTAKPAGGALQKKQNTKELSGGERSYVTVSLLLALWECVEMPFRILDEYDVFMDSANRQFSLNIMITKAAEQAGVQFIFISPQELPVMQNTHGVKIHKMPAPVRT